MTRKFLLLISLSLLSSCGMQIGSGRAGVRSADSPTGLTAWREVAGEGQTICDYRSRIVLTPHVRFDERASFTTKIYFNDSKPELDRPYAMDEYLAESGAVRFLAEYSGSETARDLTVTFRKADDTKDSAVVMDYVLDTVSGQHAEGTLETTLRFTDYLGCASPL